MFWLRRPQSTHLSRKPAQENEQTFELGCSTCGPVIKAEMETVLFRDHALLTDY